MAKTKQRPRPRIDAEKIPEALEVHSEALFDGLADISWTTDMSGQVSDWFFFLSDGCMAQRGRCPGGRPSVSANKRVQHAYYSVLKWQLYKPSMNTEYEQQSPRECRYLYWRVQ